MSSVTDSQPDDYASDSDAIEISDDITVASNDEDDDPDSGPRMNNFKQLIDGGSESDDHGEESDGPIDEVESRQTAYRDADSRRRIIIKAENRLTSNQMTLAEVTRAIAIRAKQISKNPTAYVDIGDLTDPMAIAQKEFRERKSPLMLFRSVGWTREGEEIVEMWLVRQMAYPPFN